MNATDNGEGKRDGKWGGVAVLVAALAIAWWGVDDRIQGTVTLPSRPPQ